MNSWQQMEAHCDFQSLSLSLKTRQVNVYIVVCWIQLFLFCESCSQSTAQCCCIPNISVNFKPRTVPTEKAKEAALNVVRVSPVGWMRVLQMNYS